MVKHFFVVIFQLSIYLENLVRKNSGSNCGGKSSLRDCRQLGWILRMWVPCLDTVWGKANKFICVKKYFIGKYYTIKNSNKLISTLKLINFRTLELGEFKNTNSTLNNNLLEHLSICENAVKIPSQKTHLGKCTCLSSLSVSWLYNIWMNVNPFQKMHSLKPLNLCFPGWLF